MLYFVRGGVRARSTAAAAALAFASFLFFFFAAPPRGGVPARSIRGGVANLCLPPSAVLSPRAAAARAAAVGPLRGGVAVSWARRELPALAPAAAASRGLVGGVPADCFPAPFRLRDDDGALGAALLSSNLPAGAPASLAVSVSAAGAAAGAVSPATSARTIPAASAPRYSLTVPQ